MDLESQVSQISNLTLEQIEYAKSLMDKETRKEFEDVLAVVNARADKKASIEYWLRSSDTGKKIKLTELQKLIIDFVEMVWSIGMIPIIICPMGGGKTTMSCGILADEIGRNQNIRTQVVCTSEDTAIKRADLIGQIILSKEYRKVFPHIIRDKNKPWNAHYKNVARTIKDEIEDLPADAQPGTIDATLSAYGINSDALGSRSDETVFDDLPNEDNAIISPQIGDEIDSKIDTKFLSRRESPLGVEDKDYDVTKDPFRALFICTAWAESDCIMRRIPKPNYVTLLAGVNKDFTGYNVEIWNLPDKMFEKLRSLYELHVTQEMKDTDEVGGFAKYKIGEVIKAYNVYKTFPAKFTFTVKLSRPSAWYKNLFDNNNRRFDLMYRCIVLSEQERAFPKFGNCLIQPGKPHIVEWFPINGKDDNGKEMIKGYGGSIINPPTGGLWFASADLSGMNRAGTVITVGLLLSNYKRFIVDIRVGAWAGNEITDQITAIFKKYPDIITLFVENAAQQDMFIKEALKHKEAYPWWMKVKPFITSAKNKNDKLLGVMAMDTAFANGGFMIVDTTNDNNHPAVGDTRFPEGCPCGFCILIREARSQLRMEKVSSDSLMSLWMLHSSLPQVLDIPTAGAPDGYVIKDLDQADNIFPVPSLDLLDTLMYGYKDETLTLKKHYRNDGTEITKEDEDWRDEWEFEFEEDEQEITEEMLRSIEEDINKPQIMRKTEVKKNNNSSKWQKLFEG